MSSQYKIQCLVPDLPTAADVASYLEEMQANRWYSNFGPLVTRFERDILPLASGLPLVPDGLQAVTFSSATTALELALRAMEMPQASKVLVPALTFPATALSVINAGHVPVYSDVSSETWCMEPEHARLALNTDKEIRAVVPVAAYGRPLDAAAWQMFQKETGVRVFLDAAAALGQQVVAPDVTTIYSLHATKPFGIGEGGLMLTNDADLAEKARALSNFGFSTAGTGEVVSVGTNAKMGEYYAAVGLAQLKRIDQVMERRKAVMEMYREQFAPLSNRIKFQSGVDKFVPAVFCVSAKGRAGALLAALESEGIHCRRWYLPPLHLHPALEKYESIADPKEGGLPVSEKCLEDVIGLPFHAFLSKEDIETIGAVVRNTMENQS